MNTLSKLKLSLLTLFAMATIVSCQQPKHETAADRAEQQLERLENKLDSISEDDPQFGDNLNRELNDFENAIDKLADEMAEETDKNGELVFGESHINCNLFNINAIEKIGAEKLPYHTAFKKATYMDENGKIIEPKEPNCYKFETFIFDSFEKLDSMEILRGKREEEFAPVKNKEGVDSPETAVSLYKAYYNLK